MDKLSWDQVACSTMSCLCCSKCALVNSNCACKYRIKLDNSEQWYFISQLARNRVSWSQHLIMARKQKPVGILENVS